MKPTQTPSYAEDRVSQIPALQLLINLGFEYLAPDECVKLRGGRTSNVILDSVLRQWLSRNNRVQFKGAEYPFTEGNIQAAVEALKSIPYDGLIRTNEQVYDLICLGKSLPQTIEGDTKSFSLKYIDWDTPENNVFHCTAEFSVERTGRYETRRPDIILFVNGIPLVVIECKSPKVKDAVDLAVRQNIRNQLPDEIPGLFVFSQLVLALATDQAKYATTKTPEEFWSVWREKFSSAERRLLNELCNSPLSQESKDKLFTKPFEDDRRYCDQLEQAGTREVTTQDKTLFSLCRPERLLELVYRYLVYDAGVKKIARYQQYFCVKKIMSRVTSIAGGGSRQGGVVWHTQGSGKSLTMVMLAKALALEPSIRNPRIVLVTDRVDLDDQIWKTFHHCGKEAVQAKTGEHLLKMLSEDKEQIITTVIDKFEKATSRDKITRESENVFVLVDEGHRTQYGPRHAKMRRVLPNACYIGFTGTPVASKEKDTIQKFGGLIDTYPITQAVEDKAVVPLLYEGRDVPQDVSKGEIDSWFANHTKGLTKEQKADLKRKFSTANQLNIAEKKIARIAWDISVHFAKSWKGTGFKGQLVAQRKEAALQYKKYLDDFGMVTSEVLISGPDDYEVDDEYDSEESKAKVVHFWKRMMERFGTEKEYNKQIISAFKGPDDPDIIIVVDKLLTGFDAPRNTVMYLTKSLKNHQLLQAIARVNRLHDNKEFGYILDYRGVLEELDQALDLYGSLSDFDKEDLSKTVIDVQSEIESLPQSHENVWDVFKEIPNKQDVEAFEQFLSDQEKREKFYELFSIFARTLAIALSSYRFLDDTPEAQINKYKRDLKFFKNLRTAVRRRYAETIDYSDYEPKIKKLIDTHIGAGEVEEVTPLVNIFDQDAFAHEVEKVAEPSAKADTIAHRTLKTIHERWDEDPAFYTKFSRMLQDAINAFRQKRLSANDYLNKAQEIQTSIVNHTDESIPDALVSKEIAAAYFGEISKIFENYSGNGIESPDVSVEAALGIDEILERNRIVNWTNDPDRKNMMMKEMDDFLFDLKSKHGFDLTFEEMDDIEERCLRIFEKRRA